MRSQVSARTGQRLLRMWLTADTLGRVSSADDMIYQSSRTFEVWAWGVGHRGLLLRTLWNQDQPSRIEVWFKPAHAVRLPALLGGLEITQAHADPRADVEDLLGRGLEPWERIFTVRTDGGVGWVVASGVHGREARREPHEPSMFDGWGAKPDERTLFSITTS